MAHGIEHYHGAGPFVLHYEDWDRPSTAGVSHQLLATNLKDAGEEARAYLAARQKGPCGLPKQGLSCSISQHHFFNISDLNIGSKP